MALSIDTGRALRTHKQLTELVAAIVAAPHGEPETHAIEWKSDLDLAGDVGARFKLAKQVIAFSNRHPDDAAREFEGCAYIVVGAEPQAAPRGVPTHDPAALDDWLGPFVGSDGPRWKADYVTVGDRDVFVVTVEVPRWGDPIYVLQRTYGRFSAGRSFVRRQGKTVEPDPNEMRMLEERLKRAASRVRVGVEFDGDRPTFFTYKTATANEWAIWMAAERDRLLGPLRAEMALQGPSGPLGTFARSVSMVRITADQRSPEAYEREVKEYLARARDNWQQLIWEEVIEQDLAGLELCITNPTDENYASVQIVIRLPPGVYAFTEDEGPHEVLDPPGSPAPWGSLGLGVGDIRAVRAIPLFRERAAVSIGNSWAVTFPAIDLRPHQTVVLPTVDLAIPEGFANGDELEIRWTATSTSAAGRIEGVLKASLASGGVHVSIMTENA